MSVQPLLVIMCGLSLTGVGPRCEMKMSIDLFLNGTNPATFRIASQIRDDAGREYEVTERLDAGGNAVVHECIERIGGQKWAAKFHLAKGAERLKRFRQEIS